MRSAAVFAPVFIEIAENTKKALFVYVFGIYEQSVNKKCSTLFTKNRGKMVVCKKSK